MTPAGHGRVRVKPFVFDKESTMGFIAAYLIAILGTLGYAIKKG